MKTRTRDFDGEIKKSESSGEILIPEKILDEVNEKWFYVYEWINEKEVKTSIELSFLKAIAIFWPIWVAFTVFSFFAAWLFWATLSIVFLSLLVLLYTIILSISRTIKASKINHLVITNKYFSINRKIWKIEDDHFMYLDKESEEIWKKFWENLFFESKFLQEKDSAMKNIKVMLSKGFNFINEFPSSSGKSDIRIYLYLIYWSFVLVMWLIYFLGIFSAIIVWIFLNFLIKRYLILKWNLVLSINEHFKDLEKFSTNLKQEKDSLEKNLKEASKNEWKDWLLLKINSWIEEVNKNAEKSMKENKELVDLMKNSKYDEIFDYNLYNSWIKKQIIIPIKWIIDLLKTNVILIELEIENNKDTEKNTNDEKLKWHIKVANTRLLIKKEQIEKQLKTMQWYLLKLEM